MSTDDSPLDLPTLDLPRKGLDGQGIGVRAAAWIIDGVVYYGLLLVTTLILTVVLALLLAIVAPAANVDESALPGSLDFLLSAALSLGYFAVFEWLYGATPGKVMLGLRVVDESGRPPSLVAVLVRGALRFIDGFFFALPAYFSMKSNDQQQRLGDRAAHTMVVRRSDPFIVEPRAGGYFLLAAVAALIMISFFMTFILLFGTDLNLM